MSAAPAPEARYGRGRVYPFGAAWHWKCGHTDRCHGGRERTQAAAVDAYRIHYADTHPESYRTAVADACVKAHADEEDGPFTAIQIYQRIIGAGLDSSQTAIEAAAYRARLIRTSMYSWAQA